MEVINLEPYYTLAEFSIALAGFTSIVVVFVQRGERWRYVDEYRVKNALTLSVGSAFLSLFPILLSSYELERIQIWTTSSFIMALFVIVFMANRVYYYNTKMSKKDRLVIPEKFLVLVYSLFAIALVLQVLNISKYYNTALYMNGILILLFLAFLAFLRSMFYRPSGD